MRKFALIIPIVLIFAAVLVLGSCISYPVDVDKRAKKIIVWDENIPREQSFGLFFQYGVKVTAYNGIPVDWDTDLRWTLVILPPGETVLTMDVKSPGWQGKDMVFRWIFEAGENYLLFGAGSPEKPCLTLWNFNKDEDDEDRQRYYFPIPEKIILQ